MPLHHHIDIEVRASYRRRADVALLRAAAQCTLASRRLRAPRGVSITVRRLNRDFLGQDEPTDVLAFNTDFPRLRRPDGVRELGALVIALPVAARGARDRGVVLADELALLVVHGTLHLLGFDHQTRRDDAAMRALERVALERLGRLQAARPAAG